MPVSTRSSINNLILASKNKGSVPPNTLTMTSKASELSMSDEDCMELASEAEQRNRKRPKTTTNCEQLSTENVRIQSPPAKTRKARLVTPEPSDRNHKTKRASSPNKAQKQKKDDSNDGNRVESQNALKDWQHIWSLVEELRKDRTAPCDHSGCEALPDRTGAPEQFRFQVLISLMLSSQTKDAVVGAAVRNMQKDGVLNVQSISQMDPETLQQYIGKVGFFRVKTNHIKRVADILMEKYNGDIPPTAHEMIRDLPGVGPKMAYICENAAFGVQSGIGVDTHMHRIFNLLHWVRSKQPEATRIQLEAWLPQEYWADANLLWVGFGQEVQQEKPKILKKALECSRPLEALQLLKRCGLDYKKVAKEVGLLEQVETILKREM